jgi:hypothetical protein
MCNHIKLEITGEDTPSQKCPCIRSSLHAYLEELLYLRPQPIKRLKLLTIVRVKTKGIRKRDEKSNPI